MMKKFFLLFGLSVTLSNFTSCDNSDDFETAPKTTEEAITFEHMLTDENASFSSWERSPQTTRTRGVSTDFTVYGYTTKSSTGNRKVSIGQELASHMGIQSQIYIMETITAQYELTIDGLSDKKIRFSPNDSPNCGLYPDYTNSELDLRGYSISQKGDNVTLATKMVHVICDLAGRNYNRWYPCKPEQLEWNYNVYTVD